MPEVGEPRVGALDCPAKPETQRLRPGGRRGFGFAALAFAGDDGVVDAVAGQRVADGGGVVAAVEVAEATKQ